MTAKEALRQVHKLDRAVEAAIKQMETLESDAERTTQIYGKIQAAGGNEEHGAALHRLIEARRKCNAINDEYVNVKALILDRINMLSEGDHRKVLTLVYISKHLDGGALSWDEVAAEMHYSERQAQRIHGEALVAFRSVMPDDDDVARCREMSLGHMI